MITDAQSAVELIVRIDQFAKGLLSTKQHVGPMFSVEQRVDGVFGLCADNRGKLLLDGLNLDMRDLQRHFPFAQVSPFSYEFLQMAQTVDRGQLSLALSGASLEICNLVSAQLSLMAKHLQSLYSGEEFKKDIGDFRRAINKNIASIKAYAEKMFERYSSLNIFVVDLYANEQIVCGDEVYIFDRVTEANKQFFKTIKQFSEHGLVGYVWSLNYSTQGGAKYSYIFFFDGYLWPGEQEPFMAKRISDIWLDYCSESGVSFVWNLVAPEKRLNTVAESCGLVKAADRNKNEKIEMLASYLFRHQILLKSMANFSGRSFGKGQVAKRRSLKPTPITDYKTNSFLSCLPESSFTRT